MNLSKYRDTASRFVGSAGSDFDLAVLDAINSVIQDLNTQCGLSLDEVEDFEQDYDLDDSKYGRAIRDGIQYYIQQSGTWAKESDIPKAYGRYKRSLDLAHYHALTDADPDSGTPSGEWSSETESL